MNCAYRLIWNERLNAWSVVPEIASARGKRGGGVKRSAATLLVALAVGTHATLAADLSATALPGAGQVVAGQATVSTSGANMAINQGSQRAIINWQNFDIGSQASVTFRQPDSSSVALNRVSGPTASRIEGQLNANGQVFLVNPSGVLFGGGARVNVGALVVSTLNIRDDDFLNGNYAFSGTGGTITNQGQINAAPGGYLAFISPSITNSGTIGAPRGTVAMGAGERVRLNFAGDRLIGLDVSADTIDTLITNSQAIRAEGGAILLTAAGAENVTRSVINNTGVLEAGSLTQDGGRIVLKAGGDITLGSTSLVAVNGEKGGEITLQAKSGTLLADGRIEARGDATTGGVVQLLGKQVGLVNAAQVDASGASGGGTVLIGGDYQGKNSVIQNAEATYVASGTQIKADAIQQGDGGKVIVWADNITRYFGSISADGAGVGGNGGFVETSGKATLVATGEVSAKSPSGLAGTWLLDPNNITIQVAGSNTNVSASPNFTSTNDSAIVTTGSIQTALNAGTSVTVTTGTGGTNAQAGDITVASPIAKTAGVNATLTLAALNNIVFNAGSNVSSAVGQLGLTLNAGGAITNPATINTNGGLLTFNAAGASTQSGVVSGSGGLTKSGTGALTLSGANTYTGATTVSNGTLVADNNTALGTTAGTTTVASGATLAVQGGRTLAEALTIAGNGAGGTAGAVRNISGNNTLTGVVTLGAGGARINSDAGLLTLSGANITGATQLLTVGGAGNTTISKVIATTTGTLTKDGAGTLSLAGANTYTGATNVNAGTLATSGGAIPNASAVTVAGSATLSVNAAEVIGSLDGAGNVTLNAALTAGANGSSTIFSGVMSGVAGFTKQGAGTFTLSGANTYTGTTTINAGALALSGGNAIANTGAVSLSTAGANLTLAAGETIGSLTGVAGTTVTLGANTLTTGDAGNTTYAGVIGGTGRVTKQGTGTFTLSGANTYTGTTTINAGALALSGGNAIANTGAVSLSTAGANLTLAAGETIGSLTGVAGTTVTLGANTLTTGDAGNTTYAGVIGGTGRVTKQGAGTFTLSGANTYTGLTTVSAGTLAEGANNALSSGGLTVSGGTFDIGTFTDTVGAVTLASGNIAGTTGVLTGTSYAVQSGAISAILGGAGALTKTTAGTVTLSGANTYTGVTTISAGTLTASGGNAIADTSQVTLANAAGATLNLAGNETIGNLSGGGATGGNVTLGTNTLTVNETAATTYTGVISGSGGLTKQGAAALTLSGANTYTGATTINAGTLALGAANRIADTSAVTVGTGATFNLGGFAETVGSIAGAGNITLGAGTLTSGGNNTSTTFSGVASGTGGLAKLGTGTRRCRVPTPTRARRRSMPGC